MGYMIVYNLITQINQLRTYYNSSAVKEWSIR